jgi:hypothetical protein
MSAKYTSTELKKMMFELISTKFARLYVELGKDAGATNDRVVEMLVTDTEFTTDWLQKYADRFVRLNPAEAEVLMDRHSAPFNLADKIKMALPPPPPPPAKAIPPLDVPHGNIKGLSV